MSEPESEFKTSLRPWLSRKLDGRDILNLRWENPVEQVYFRIPWNKKDQDPNWEKEYELFKAWAIHRGTYEPGMPWAKLKSNFRSVLSKSNDFEEVKERRVEKLQTGNYRVYKRLTHKEAKEKQKKNSKKRKIEQKPSHVNESEVQSTSHCCKATPELSGLNSYPGSWQQLGAEGNECYAEVNQPPLLNGPGTQVSPVSNNSQSTYHLQYSDASSFSHSQVSNFDQLLDERDSELFQTAPGEFPVGENMMLNKGDSNFVDSLLTELESQQPTVVPHVMHDDAMSGDSINTLQPNNGEVCNSIGSIFQHIMSQPGMDASKIWQCHVVVRYRKNQVGETVVFLNDEHRLHYGPEMDQKLGILAVRSQLPSEFKTLSTQLPEIQGTDPLVEEVLGKFDQGVVLSMDNNGNMFVTRLCQDHVYYYEQGNENEKPIKLERKTQTKIFSYETFIGMCIQHKNDPATTTPASTVRLHIGIRPKHHDSFGLVSITLMPVLADDIMQYVIGNDMTQPAYSIENSVDWLIRQTDSMNLGAK
uniref:IRF-like-2 interferon regulatory factor like protein n=1 Tax=Phallusia mammillata TaxID=59560 RepID=A0A6F9DFU2_9ASCI|nr:IRF-like-2 interferon regulatory factor like protein [Phallusia mammillata]